ncbi:MAG TPA: 4Fe-4S dicluster domain-containing protein, partial [Nitrospiraceae bacterium]|nr:4Fe-4S dicluster domain-containing protein [Nitrospiraceae bacterium]
MAIAGSRIPALIGWRLVLERCRASKSMKTLSLIQPIDQGVLEKETLRIYDICDGCRRCFNLCPSFNTLLDRIDEYQSDVTKLTPSDHHRVVDECYYCKLCFNHCPYTPP